MISEGARKPPSPTAFSPSCAYSTHFKVLPVLNCESMDKADAYSVSVKR